MHLQIALKLAADQRAQAAHRVKLEKESARQTAILVRLAENFGLTDDWCAPSLSLSLSPFSARHAQQARGMVAAALSLCL